MSSNYENTVKTTTTDLLNNNLWWLWRPDEHLRCRIEKIKKYSWTAFEGEANNKLLMNSNSKYVSLTLVLNILIL